MPFRSEAQRRLFFAKMNRGEISPSVVQEWNDATPKGKKLPERLHKKAFWQGFTKRADAGGAGDGGGGFSGVGKGNLIGNQEPNFREGLVGQSTAGAGDGTLTEKNLLDRERGPRDFSPFQEGPELENESGPPSLKY